MWTTHAGHHGSRAQTRIAKSTSESTAAFGTANLDSPSRSRPAAPQHHQSVSALEADNCADFLEPAVDGPPSPAIIRAFNDKVKQSSVSDRHGSQPNTSSGAPSLTSYVSSDRRPSWELALDSFSLSRKSSIKSTTSSMPSKDRPESVQAIGKAIFQRKSRLRRESLTGNSIHPADVDMTCDRGRALSSISKEHILAGMSLFNRRKTVHTADAAQKKPMISNPYNFQHVAQINREHLPGRERGDSSTFHGEPVGVSTPPALGDDLRVPNFASGRTRSSGEDDSVPPHVVLHNRENSASRPSPMHRSHPKLWLKTPMMQDHIQIRGTPPPRPPRSPVNTGYFDYIPHSAVSPHPSRPSIPRRDSEALGSLFQGRQQSTTGFRHQSHHAVSPSATSSGPPSPFTTQERRLSRVFTPVESPNWPLSAPLHSNHSVTAFEAALPEVPEEEEQCGVSSKSRLSVKSANSSLKGSISVPALRKSSLSAGSESSHDHAFSRDSVVLGTFDMSAFRQVAEDDMLTRAHHLDHLRRDSWEAVIDYCYEHEMEADCDYDWHRPSLPSLDLDREPTLLITDSADDSTIMSRPPSDCLEMPILSPSRHLSPQSSQGVITPRLAGDAKSPGNANFSLPRRERPQRLLHVRKESEVSFTEAQGFPLSPSFLIPTDYHQELLAAHQKKLQDTDLTAQADLFVPARASASTTMSNSNLSSQSISERHISSTSTSTDYTDLTMSVSSEDLEGFNFKDETPAATIEDQEEAELPLVSPTHSAHSRCRSAADLLGAAKSPGLSRDTHSSDPDLANLRFPSAQKPAAGRARSRTLSSTPANFSLFPIVTKAPPRG